mmetsp:Transcript_41699/g.82300  ORF Transcript_41699/g.82300 Transcript_41699/m.82300 type:complete len:489 (+) Transcript_41699:132-1598(+)
MLWVSSFLSAASPPVPPAVEAFAESLDALNRGLQEEKEESSHLFGLPVKRFDALRDWLESLRKDKVLCRDTVSRLLKSPAQVPPSALSELLEASRLLSPRLSLVGREQIVSFLFSAVEAHRERRLEPVESSEALYGVLFLNKADDLVREGKFEEAMEAYETALRVRKQVFGEDSQCPETALILNRMASLFMRQKKHEEAVRRLRSETAAVFERLSFKDTENAAKAAEHHKVAKSFAEKAKLREAEKGYRQALQVKKRVFGDVHLSIANTTSNLAVVLQRQRKYGEALEMYEETLRVKKTIFGDEHPATADTLYSMGVLLETQGEYKKAHEMFEEALRVRKQVLGDQHPDTASTHLCVARTEEACRGGERGKGTQIRQRRYSAGRKKRKNEEEKSKNFCCSAAGCERSFDSQKGLRRHVSSVHQKPCTKHAASVVKEKSKKPKPCASGSIVFGCREGAGVRKLVVFKGWQSTSHELTSYPHAKTGRPSG